MSNEFNFFISFTFLAAIGVNHRLFIGFIHCYAAPAKIPQTFSIPLRFRGQI